MDWSGRAVRNDKRAYIPENGSPIVERLGAEKGVLIQFLGNRSKQIHHAIGPVSRLQRLASSFGQKFIKGLGLSRRLCPGNG